MIGIFDYGVGNIRSVENALSELGIKHSRIINNQASDFDKLIIPGVGAFPNCINEFKARGFAQILSDHIDRGRGVLGICVGHQMLFESSDEFQRTEGLSIFKGAVERLDKDNPDFKAPLPNINWLPLSVSDREDTPSWIKSYNGEVFYFLHSFAARANNQYSRAYAEYNGIQFSAIASYHNVVGVQFHPEKSGKVGLSFLKSFSNRSF